MPSILLDHDAIETIFQRYRESGNFFDELSEANFGGIQFGSFDDKEADQRAEMASLLFAVEGAKENFTLVSLGAAPGEWAIKGERAYRAARPNGQFISFCLEGDQEHYELTKKCIVANGGSLHDHNVSYRVVADRDGYAYFPIINSELDWGAGIAALSDRPETLSANITISDLARSHRLGALGAEKLEYRTVDAVALPSLFKETGFVDYLHSDIQGAEGDVFTANMDAMDAYVRVACISTHGKEIEKKLIEAFAARHWKVESLFPCQSTFEPVGEVVTRDGIFTWSNPRFGSFP